MDTWDQQMVKPPCNDGQLGPKFQRTSWIGADDEALASSLGVDSGCDVELGRLNKEASTDGPLACDKKYWTHDGLMVVKVDLPTNYMKTANRSTLIGRIRRKHVKNMSWRWLCMKQVKMHEVGEISSLPNDAMENNIKGRLKSMKNSQKVPKMATNEVILVQNSKVLIGYHLSNDRK